MQSNCICEIYHVKVDIVLCSHISTNKLKASNPQLSTLRSHVGCTFAKSLESSRSTLQKYNNYRVTNFCFSISELLWFQNDMSSTCSWYLGKSRFFKKGVWLVFSPWTNIFHDKETYLCILLTRFSMFAELGLELFVVVVDVDAS